MAIQIALSVRGRKFVSGGLMALMCGFIPLPAVFAADPPKIVMPQPAAHWRVEYERPARETGPEEEANLRLMGGPQKRSKVVEYKVFQDTAEITTTYEDGTRDVVYLIGDYVYRHDPFLKKDVIESVIPDDINQRCRKVYPEFSFPLAQYYDGKIEAFEQPCFYYRSDRAPADPDEPDRELWEAWVSATSGRPVAFRHGKTLAKFQFLPAPTSPVVLPQSFVDLVKASTKPDVPRGSRARMSR